MGSGKYGAYPGEAVQEAGFHDRGQYLLAQLTGLTSAVLDR